MTESDTRRTVVKALTDKVLNYDNGSVYDPRQLRKFVRQNVEMFVRSNDADTAVDAVREERVSRREFLKAMGVLTAAGTVSYIAVDRLIDKETITGLQVSDNGSYETIRSDELETIITVGSGDTFENRLIDITDNDPGFQINANGADWEIRNVGIQGEYTAREPGAKLAPGVDEGSEALIQSVYMPGTSLDEPNRIKNVWALAEQHRGELTFRDSFFKNGADNQLYCSGPSRVFGPDEGGEINFENVHSENAGVSHIRVGSHSHIRDCTVLCDEAVPPVPAPPFGQPRNPRGIWIPDDGEVEIENCDVYMDPPHDTRQAVLASEASTAYLRDSEVHGDIGTGGHHSATIHQENVGDDPDPEPNDGVPVTAEQAAQGVSSTREYDRNGNGAGSGNGDGLGLDPC